MTENLKRPRYPEIVTRIFLLLMLSAFLLWPGTGGYQTIGAAKYGMFRALAGGYVLTMVLLAIEMPAMGQARLPDLRTLFRKITPVQGCLLLYLLLTAVSALASPYWPATLKGISRNEGLITIALYVLCCLLVSVFGEWRREDMYVFGASVSVFCIIAILQLCGRNPLGLYPEGLNYFDAGTKYSGAFLGTIGNVDLAAEFLCLAAPCFLFSALFLRGKERYLLLIPAVLSVTVLVWMRVDAGYAGFFVGSAASLPLLLRAKGRRAKTAGIAVVCLFAAVGAGVFLMDIGTGTLHQMHELLHGHWEADFGSGRLYIWRETLKLVPQNLWLGTGPDTLAAALHASFSRQTGGTGLNIAAVVDAAHNEYLNILACQGLPALLSYLAALALSAAAWIRRGAENPKAAVAGSVLLCCCIQAFFGISMCITAPYFWLALGLLEHEMKRGKIPCKSSRN